MTGFVCRKLTVLLLVDLDKGHFGGIRKTSERHPRDIREAFLASFDGKTAKKTCELVFFSIKAFFVEWTARETVFRIGEGSIFIFVYQ